MTVPNVVGPDRGAGDQHASTRPASPATSTPVPADSLEEEGTVVGVSPGEGTPGRARAPRSRLRHLDRHDRAARRRRPDRGRGARRARRGGLQRRADHHQQRGARRRPAGHRRRHRPRGRARHVGAGRGHRPAGRRPDASGAGATDHRLTDELRPDDRRAADRDRRRRPRRATASSRFREEAFVVAGGQASGAREPAGGGGGRLDGGRVGSQAAAWSARWPASGARPR